MGQQKYPFPSFSIHYKGFEIKIKEEFQPYILDILNAGVDNSLSKKWLAIVKSVNHKWSLHKLNNNEEEELLINLGIEPNGNDVTEFKKILKFASASIAKSDGAKIVHVKECIFRMHKLVSALE